ncbi:MAG: hypothetical protein ACRD0Q_04505 [Acidimicrobiales bacterium]
MTTPPPPPDREWVSFEDAEEDRTWVFDVTFLLSRWACIYGRGCQGVLTAPAPELALGCCSYGAHFSGPDDVARVEEAAAGLGPEEWQFRAQGRRRGVTKTTRAGEVVTRMVDDACVFLNRPGFPGGVGCALHRAALARGVSPVTTKPDVCWQLPLRREDREDGDGHVTSTVGEWGRRQWGAGGADFHWWCTEAAEAFVGDRPVYLAMAEELVCMVGEPVYERVAAELARRQGLRNRSAPLPHPTVRAAGRR